MPTTPDFVEPPASNKVRLVATVPAARTKRNEGVLGEVAGMSEQDFARRYASMQRYVGWTDSDAARVAALWPLVAPYAKSLIDDFYAEIQRHPDASRVITGGRAQIERLSQTLREWLAQLFSGEYDVDYISRRWRVGYRHVEIGLEQRFTSLALSRLRTGITQSVCASWRGKPEDLAAGLNSVNKLLDLDHALIQDAYEFEHVRRERLFERQRGERKFRHLVENASCLIMIVDATRAAVYFNPYAESATGYSAAEIERSSELVMAVLGGDDADSRLPTVLAGDGPAAYETQIERRGGTPRWINWTLSRIDGIDDEPAVLAVGHDVTEQRRAAAQVLQANRLATIGEMYARLAHESRNALQRMRVCTEMLTDQLAGSPDASELLKRSEHAQHDLQRLLDEVRNFAAPIVLEKTECRLHTLWREAWNLLQSVRRDRRAELIEVTSAAGGESMRLDRFRMVQAFRNIFENSLAACGDPLRLTVSCRPIMRDDATWIELIVDDNGGGFTEAAKERAFEPFFTTRASGTGLGLAIVRRVVEAHGGEVAVANVPRGGARIAILLPGQLQAGSASEANGATADQFP
jgi:two-component system sensor kinase FixL